MTARRRVRLVVAGITRLACVVAVVGAARPDMSVDAAQAQQRDGSAARAERPPAGTALLAGVVTGGTDSDAPVRRAIVTLSAGDGSDARSLVTDDDGRFAFRGLPAGRYTLTADKPAYLRNSFGARRPGRPGTSIALAEAQQLTGVRVVLPRGAVITGTLRLATGEPLADTQVVAIPIAQAEAGGRLVTAGEFTSDDRGVYRIFGLAPGDYLVGALPSVGRGEIEVRARSYDEVVRELAQPGGRPALPAARAAAAQEARMVGYTPTYYPGTPVASVATPVTVGLGEEREGVDIPIALIQMATISGVVTGVDGRPAPAVTIAADAIGPPLPLSGLLGPRPSRPDRQGRFTISNVPPGSYRITALGGGVTLNPDGSLRSISTGEQTDWAVASVQVSGDDIDGLALRLQPGMTFSGTLAAAGSGAAPDSWQGARISIEPVGRSTPGVPTSDSPLSGVTVRSAITDEKGAFQVTGIQPGDYDVQVRLPPAVGRDWTVRAITANGADLRDAPLTFEHGSIDDVTIAMTDQHSLVTGVLSSASGAPASDYFIVIFAADRGLWHPRSPRVQVVRPGDDGTFFARDLPAGDYRVAALTDVADDEWRSASFLEQLLPASIPIVVKDGETTRQDIRIK
ncbi:MAG: carboxypeptidase-like regulatory domain-containing protein [Vicinamibacterales bacterium]